MTTIALISPGDMGQRLGSVLRGGGHRVVTSLAGRSQASRDRAQQAGFEVLADDASVVREADVMLSVVPPSEAEAVAVRFEPLLRASSTKLLYVDCNAVAPSTVGRIAERLHSTSVRFVDAAITSGSGRPGRPMVLFASGAFADEFVAIQCDGVSIRALPGEAGQASGLKMCLSALTKGFAALAIQTLVTADRLGLTDIFDPRLLDSESAFVEQMLRFLPQVPSRAGRWVDEMEEVAGTFESVGLDAGMGHAPAELYRFVERALAAGDLDLADLIRPLQQPTG